MNAGCSSRTKIAFAGQSVVHVAHNVFGGNACTKRRGAEEQEHQDAEHADEERAVEPRLDPAMRERQQQVEDARERSATSRCGRSCTARCTTTRPARSATTTKPMPSMAIPNGRLTGDAQRVEPDRDRHADDQQLQQPASERRVARRASPRPSPRVADAHQPAGERQATFNRRGTDRDRAAWTCGASVMAMRTCPACGARSLRRRLYAAAGRTQRATGVLDVGHAHSAAPDQADPEREPGGIPPSDLDQARRTSMAAERTWLAWWRSALAASAGALAVGRLAPDVLAVAPWPYILLGCGYAALAIGLLLVGAQRQRAARARAADRRAPPLSFRTVGVFTAGGVVLAVHDGRPGDRPDASRRPRAAQRGNWSRRCGAMPGVVDRTGPCHPDRMMRPCHCA